jgi:hypothetical protein
VIVTRSGRDLQHDVVSAGRPGGAENDSTCSPADTLTEPKQRQAATAYIVAFYERQLKGNTRFDPLLTGAASFPVPGVTADRKFSPPAR